MKPVRAAKPAGQLSSSQRPSSTARGVKFELGPDDEDNFVVMAPPKRSSGGGGLQAHRESRDHEVRHGCCCRGCAALLAAWRWRTCAHVQHQSCAAVLLLLPHMQGRMKQVLAMPLL
jgi:hypothetical protein